MNAKKIIFLSSFLGVLFCSYAQIDHNSLGQLNQIAYTSLSISKSDPLLGTARYTGMGGAMGAFGGDATTLKDNPAGVGTYRKSDLTFTPNVYIDNNGSVGFNVNNFAFVLKLRDSGNSSGYVTSSLGVGYNRLKNFSRFSDSKRMNLEQSMTDYIYLAGDYFYEDAYNAELIDDNDESLFARPIDNRLRYSETGSVNEWNLSYGVNISNLVYLGISTGFVNFNYKLKTMYDETNAVEKDSWYFDNKYEAVGNGFNFKLGAIIAPVDFLRIGLAFHTPTFYNNITEYLEEEIGDKYYPDDPLIRDMDYRSALQTPLKAQGSLGILIGKRAIVGFEYQFEDFSAMRFSSDGILLSKEMINDEMNISHTAKAGTEVIVINNKNAKLLLRAGFAFVSSPTKRLSSDVYSFSGNFQQYPLAQTQNSFYYTGGVGFRGKYFYADLAYMHQVKEEYLFEYLPLEDKPHNLKLHTNNISATVGFRF